MGIRALISLLFFWGTWLLVPVVIDLCSALYHVGMVFTLRRELRKQSALRRRHHKQTLDPLPMVTVVIPFRNGGGEVWRTLVSLAAQSYPLERLDIVCVSNGTDDESITACQHFQMINPHVRLRTIELPQAGKSNALNAGILATTGPYVCNVDADIRLHPHAIRHMVAAFEMDATLGAATGSIQVDPTRIQRDGWLGVVQICEWMEYLSAFQVGRIVQSRNASIYTLAGAFSFYRRDFLFGTFLYGDVTVAEDAKLTRDLQLLGPPRVVCIHDAVAYVHPTDSLARLFSQRIRWQRGQLEVMALHPEYAPTRLLPALRTAGGRLAVGDHTLAFPRMSWMIVLPMLASLGYPVSTVVLVLVALYVLYVLTELLLYRASMHTPKAAEQQRWTRQWSALLGMPFYRSYIFLARLAGMLVVLTEPARWRVVDPFTQLWQTLAEDATRVLRWLRPGHRPPSAPSMKRGIGRGLRG